MLRAAIGGCITALLVLSAAPAIAQTSSTGAGPPRLTVRWSLKGTGVGSTLSREGLWRARVEPTFQLGSAATFDLAYEQRARASSDVGAGAGFGLEILPSDAPPPYRLTPFDWEIASGRHATWRHEIDRAALHARAGGLSITAGRQAIGWGRGVLFGAIDLFSPFSPFEIDREWRRGVDALRVDAPITPHGSADLIAAFGRGPDDSTYAGRVRGYRGDIDVQVAAGRRARDGFVGAASSFVLGPAEVHVEVAAFRTPAVAGSSVFASTRTVMKAVVGGSSRLGLGTGVLLHLEYHYSGFGADGAERIVTSLDDEAFSSRVARGDTQILTRHALAVVASYEWSPLLSGSAALVLEPTDGSGVVMPSATLTFGDRWSLVASGYVGFGRGRTQDALRSAYGVAPTTALVQVRYYR